MFCFQAAGGAVSPAGEREPLLEAGARDAGVKFLGEWLRLFEQLLAFRRIEPSL